MRSTDYRIRLEALRGLKLLSHHEVNETRVSMLVNDPILSMQISTDDKSFVHVLQSKNKIGHHKFENLII